MSKKFTVLCSLIIALSVCVAMFGATNNTKNDLTTATIKKYYAPKSETTTNGGLGGIVNDVLGGIGSNSSSDKIDGVIGSIEGVSGDIEGAIGGFGDSMGSLGGIGDAFGGVGDSLGGIGDSLGGVGGGLGDSLGGIFGGLGGNGSGTVVKTTTPQSTTSADIGLIIPVPAATQTTTENSTVPLTSAVGGNTGETVDYANTSNPYTKPTSTFVAGDENEAIKWIQWIFIYSGYGLNDDGITGVLDEDTVAVIKKLQHENKLTVDGNITEDVIKAAEVLYYQSILGDDVSAIEVSSEAITGVNVSNQAENNDGANDIPVALLIVVLVIIWVLAIGGIVLLFIFKKKKINASKQKNEEKKANEEKNDKKTEISSLSDLFEEAEKDEK